MDHQEKKFFKERADSNHPDWPNMKKRREPIYLRDDDIRSEFNRDYNRILHCRAYRRLKHKTQVFFATSNDHICTRLEHVNHVSSVSYSICAYLGLNTELCTAIAIGHDLGHAPFGHVGEKILKDLLSEYEQATFWHEANSLRFVDRYETLPDPFGFERNLNLTYAVRDGIVCHCGEVDDRTLQRRRETIDLDNLKKADEYPPFTWEGCVVKIADKIAYIGRDIEDALKLGILHKKHMKELMQTLGMRKDSLAHSALNNTVLIHAFVMDICKNSNPSKGLSFSATQFARMKAVKDFSDSYIYHHERLKTYTKYAELIIRSIFETLASSYDSVHLIERWEAQKKVYPTLASYFIDWLIKYTAFRDQAAKKTVYAQTIDVYQNERVFGDTGRKDYIRTITDFISAMTDSFAIRIFEELTSFS